jgi:hypothetical protein
MGLASELECGKADPSTARPDAPEYGAEEKSGRSGRDDKSLEWHEVGESELGEAECSHEN